RESRAKATAERMVRISESIRIQAVLPSRSGGGQSIRLHRYSGCDGARARARSTSVRPIYSLCASDLEPCHGLNSLGGMRAHPVNRRQCATMLNEGFSDATGAP